MAKVYLDTCAVNRPFDDQTQPRIRLESECLIRSLQRIMMGIDIWVDSDVLHDEINQIPDQTRQRRLRAVIQFATDHAALSGSVALRGEKLHGLGFKGHDALHIACAEQAGCEILMTTDDRMLGTALRHKDHLHLRVMNPVQWIRETEP